jgi:hypothetical protein
MVEAVEAGGSHEGGASSPCIILCSSRAPAQASLGEGPHTERLREREREMVERERERWGDGEMVERWWREREKDRIG